MRIRRGFTLIELLIVLGIIVLLMAILVPSINSAARTAKIAEARTRITTLAAAVREYRRVYSGWPPDTSPNRSMKAGDVGSYPATTFADGTSPSSYLFNHGSGNDHPFGGKFLAYFLMGPHATGWHRPRDNVASDPDYPNRGITAEWDVPEGVSSFVRTRTTGTGAGNGCDYPCFTDGFGLSGYNGGVIGYIRARTFYDQKKQDCWDTAGAFSCAFYWDCRWHPSYPGDKKGPEQQTKIFSQCPDEFVLLSPGPDQKYGYRVTIMEHNGVWMRGSWSSLDKGLIDDIASFPLN